MIPPTKKATVPTNGLYSFLGVHSFLIGIFLFYIPVYLYNTGFSLAKICSFIAITGLGFCSCLYIWDRISKRVPLNYLIIFSFLSEFVLLSLFFLQKDMTFLLLSGFFNGVFNCSFWMIQRLLFIDTITLENSGKKFGNFQIFVLVILKAGIFTGGIFIEKSGFMSVYLFSAGIVIAAIFFFWQKGINIKLNETFLSSRPLNIKRVTGFKDHLNSRIVFLLDGIFLYLESYFWMLSLFFIVKQSYWKLGVLVIFLMIIFGAIFIIIKNYIDRLPHNKMYSVAVILYCFSWVLRGVLSEKFNNLTILLALAIITFCTSIFRLAFNKRFFDIAKSTTSHEYIFIKSYFSQFFLTVFALLGFCLLRFGDVLQLLSLVYLTAAPVSLVYLFYRPYKKSLSSSLNCKVFDK